MNSQSPPLLPFRPRSAISAWFRNQRLLNAPAAYPRTTGQLRSFRENRPVDADGNPLPWINYPLIGILEERLKRSMRVFEYGCGYSSLFFAGRVASVVSVEHSAEWAELVNEAAADLDGDLSVRLAEAGQDYINSPADDEPYDLILVDGLDRDQCLAVAAGCLSERGVILLDDSHRPEYAGALRRQRDQGMKVLRLRGPKPNSLVEAESAVIYPERNCLGL